jgi:hypothetical protein
MFTNIIRVMKSRWMRKAGHVARMREMRNAYNSLVLKPEGRGFVKWMTKAKVGGLILKWILGISGSGMWIGLIWLKTGTGGGIL